MEGKGSGFAFLSLSPSIQLSTKSYSFLFLKTISPLHTNEFHSDSMFRSPTCSLLFSHSVLSSSQQPHGWRHARLPCPSPSTGVCSNSCLLSRWCHLTTSSSLASFSSCLQSFPALASFPMSRLLALGGQSIGASASYSFQWIFRLIFFRIDRFDLLAVQGSLKSLLWHHNLKTSILQCSAFFMGQLSHLYMITGKTIALTRQTFVAKMMFLLFNTLSRFVIAFLQRSKCLLIS